MEPEDKESRYKKASFSCPHCTAFAQQRWSRLYGIGRGFFSFATCEVCQTSSIWASFFPLKDVEKIFDVSKENSWKPIQTAQEYWEPKLNNNENMKMVYPETLLHPPLSAEAGEQVCKLYEEANSISGISPRAATILLRAAIELLCRSLLNEKDAEGKTLDALIKEVAKKYHFEVDSIDALHNIRKLGNQAAHPTEILLDENLVQTLDSLFFLVRDIVDHALSRAERIKKENDDLKRKIQQKKELNQGQKKQ